MSALHTFLQQQAAEGLSAWCAQQAAAGQFALSLADIEKKILTQVHGAIAGWYGHVATVLPGEDSMQTIYVGGEGG